MADYEDFTRLLRDFLGDERKRKPLDDLLARATPKQLLECVSPFFALAEQYGEGNARVQYVFIRLTTLLLDKGDVYFALRLEILLRTPGKQWRSCFSKLSPPQQRSLTRRIAAKKAHLPSYARSFITLFDKYARGNATQQDIQTFISKLKTFEPHKVCLLTYMEVSQGYTKDSSLIFFGVSFETLNKGGADFAAMFDANIKDPQKTWHRRFRALEPYYQDKLNGLIKEKLTIATTVTTKGKTIEVPTGKYNPGALTLSKADDVDEHTAASITASQKQFLDLVRAGNDERLHAFLRESPFPKLRECVFGFVEASKKKAFDDRAVTYFAALLETAVAKGDAYYASKIKLLVNSPDSLWAKLHQRFSAFHKNELTKEINRSIHAARLIDDLKFAYFVKHHKDPDATVLRRFDLPAAQEQVDNVAKALAQCDAMINAKSVDGWITACAKLTDALRAGSDPLVMTALIRQCRERRGLAPTFRHLLYLTGVGLLYLRLLKTRPHVYKNGFSEEEHALFIAPEYTRDPYFGDFVLQLEDVMWRRLGEDRLASIAQGIGALHIQAARMGMQLTPMREAAVVTGLAEKMKATKPDAIAATRIPVYSRWSDHKTVPVFATIGNVFVYWWDSNRGIAYLQVQGYEKMLFSVGSYRRLGELADEDAFYGAIFRATSHLLVLIPFLFEVLGYIPDLVTGGMTGLLKSVAFDLAFEKMVAATGVDGTTAQLLLLGAGLLHSGGTTKKSDVHVEADPSAFQQAARDRMPVKPETPTTRGVDAPLTTHGGPDVRLTEKEPVLRRSVEGDVTPSGTRIRGEDDVPAITDPDENLSAAYNHLEDLQKNKIPQAAAALDQTEKSLGDVEALLETVKNPTRRDELLARKKRLEDVEARERSSLAQFKAEEQATRKTIQALDTDERSKNLYPDFEDPTSAFQPIINEKVRNLSQQLGIPLDPKYTLEAPWIGRPHNQEGARLSSGTSQGWLRNDYRFWKKWKERFSREYALLGPEHTVTREFADAMRWPPSTIGQKLEHHHIDNGQFVYPVPANLHEAKKTGIHATVTYPK